MTKQKTKLSIATCRVLLGVGLALGASSLYAATTINDTNIEENFTKNGNNITFTGDDFEIELSDVTTRDWGNDKSPDRNELYPREMNFFDVRNMGVPVPTATAFYNFNARNESITINAGDSDLTLTTTHANTLNNFTLTSKGDISATNIYFRALLGVSSFNGNTEITGGGLYVDGGSIVVNGDLTLGTGAKLGFNADRLSAIQVRGNADLSNLAAGDIQLSSTSIQSFNNAVLVNVTGEGNTLTTTGIDDADGVGTPNIVTAALQIDDRNYIETNLNDLSGVVGAGASFTNLTEKEGDTLTFAKYLAEEKEGERFLDVLDLSNLASYVLNTNKVGNSDATQLLISGGATNAVLSNGALATEIEKILDKYSDGTDGLLHDFATAADIDITANSTSSVKKAIDAIAEQRAALGNLTSNTYVETRIVNGNPTDVNLALVADRAAYDALVANQTAGVEKGMLKYTRNDVFVQNIGNISTNNQNIVARYLDGLELKLKGRTETGSGDDNAYNSTDLHTGDVGAFNDSQDGGRTGRDGNGNLIYDNGAVLDNIARIKLEGGVANTLANQYRESAKSISNTNSAMSSVDSILNITNELSLSSRIAMHDNPYNSYAYQMRGVELAAIASDMSPNYVDTYSSGVWINAFGGANVIDGNSGGVYGVSLGLDAKVSDNVLLGAYFTYADADIKDNLIKQESDNFQIGLYSSVQLAPLWELNLKLFGQISPNDQYRYDVLGSYDSDFTRKSLGFNGNIGRAFKFQQETFVLKPFLGVNYYYTHTPSYSESGAAGFDKVNSATNNTISLDVGAEFRKYTSVNSYLFVTPKIEQYILNNGDDFRATLGGIAMPVVSGADKNKTYGQIIIGGNFDISQDFSANIGAGVKQIFAGKVDSKDETYVSGQVGFKYKF